ncbi:HNH endonuclease [Candidatus Woesearchaeota archaeon]|nr:HNH endonuclease [Candidatus Woesearchaeota archaeon]
MIDTQQKLGRRNTCTPLGASQAQSPVVMSLNREETLSEHSLKTLSNSLDVNQQPGKAGQGLRVPVLNMRGKPLMSTNPTKARHLLEQGKAKVAKRTPFVIQMLMATGETKQEITLGIDAGYNNIGFSAVTKKEELISGEVKLRKDVRKKLEERRMYRRQKRNKLWHRKARFNNRKQEENWLSPSMQHKLDTHTRLIEKIRRWLPITTTVIEVANFDTQKMQNPEILGIEYQQGELQGYHIREYLLEKFNRQCVYCKKKDVPLEVEHIIPKSRGGSNRVSNLTTSCKKCNLKKADKTAEEFGFLNIQKLAKESLKATAFMNVVRKRLAEKANAEETFGYITKKGRIDNNLEKNHINDGFIIAKGTNQKRCKPYHVNQIRRNNRSIQTNRKGFKPSIRKQRYKLQPNDLVRYNNDLHKVCGIFNYGNWIKLQNGTNTNIKNVELIQYGKGLSFN